MNVARNDPCPCGSGKKFKKCCFANVQASRSPVPALSLQDALTAAAALHQKGDLEQAILRYAEILKIDPKNADVLNYMGVACCQVGNLDIGLEMIKKAISYKPTSFEAYNNLISVLEKNGDLSQRVEWLRKGIRIRFDSELPDRKIEATRMAWIYWLIGSETASNETVLEDCRAWISHSRLGKTEVGPPKVAMERGTPLRIGCLVSFLDHSNYVQLFHSLLSYLDETDFELYIYNFGKHAPEFDEYDRVVFRDLEHTESADTIKQIQQDGIHILLDYNGFADIRTVELLFHRIAPVQAIFANIYSTTCIPMVDYVFSYESCVPRDEDKFYAETLYRLPDSCFVISVPEDAPPVVPSPYLTNGYFTFGCFSSNYKINKPVIELWVRVLKACQNSRFIVKGINPATQSQFNALMKKEGLALDRLIVEGVSGHREYLESYGKVDLVLDTFPYNGVTTTNEALTQGVPVVTIYGNRWPERFAALMLSGLGLGALVADGPEAYVDIACRFYQSQELAQDLRRTLRQIIMNSPSADKLAYVREVEKSLAWMWQRWLESQPAVKQ